jgi:hypothetical protein
MLKKKKEKEKQIGNSLIDRKPLPRSSGLLPTVPHNRLSYVVVFSFSILVSTYMSAPVVILWESFVIDSI